MGTHYEQVYTGEWLPYARRNQKIRCCDCGLVHVLNFRIRKGQLEIQTFIDRRATGQIRRWGKVKLAQKRKSKK